MRERDRNRRAARPGVEGVEARELLSGLLNVLSVSQPSSAQLLGVIMAKVMGGGTPNQPPPPSPYPLLGQGQASPQEIKRETFKAYFAGPFFIGPGRFSDQASTIYIRGIGGTNQFLHGDFNMAVVTPIDPATPRFGAAVLNDKSTQTSGIIGLDLVATAVDSRGRPTHLSFESDQNIYSGIYFINKSSGTVDIKYNDKTGQAAVRFNGLVYTNGLASPLVNSDLYSRHNRPLRFRGH